MIFTLPNAISAFRIALVPVFWWLLVVKDDANSAGWLLGFIGGTDWIDGYLARKLNQVSELGKFLDPAADRLAVAAAVVGGWISGALPWWICLAIIIRESVVALGALVVGLKARSKIEVRYYGKVATLGLYFAISWFLVGRGTDTAWLEWAGWGAVIPSLILYYVVAWQYLGDMRASIGGNGELSSGATTSRRDG